MNTCSGPGGTSPATPNPISIGTGNKSLVEPDPIGSVRGSLRLVRYYNSSLYMAREKLGPRWRHSYDLKISPVFTDAGSFAAVRRSNGQVFSFFLSGGSWSPDADVTDILKRLDNANGAQVGWQYLTADGLTEVYDIDGKLSSISDLVGRSQILTYDGTTGLLSTVQDNFGRTLSFRYDLNSRLVAVLDSAGLQVAYAYDAFNNLASVTYPDGSVKNYHYNESQSTIGTTLSSALTGITDESGARYASYEYDDSGRATGETLAGDVASFGLSFSANSTTVTDPLGAVRTYSFQTILGVTKSTGRSQPGGPGCSASSSGISYDANGNVSSRTDFAGSKVCYGNDLSRNLETARIEGYAAGDSCPTNVGAATPGATQRKITTQWHPSWRLETRRAEPKRITTRVYNGQPDPTRGNTLATCAPTGATLPDGQPIAVLCKEIEQATTDTTGATGFNATNDSVARIWGYTYNTYGQLLTADGPRTDVADITTVAYYPDTTANWTLGDVKTVTNAVGHTWNYTQYDKAGRLLAATNPNGTALTYSYTPRGWLKTRTLGGQTTTYDYTPWGGVAKVTLADGSYTAYTWDAAHRLTDISDSVGNTTHLTLDNAGNITLSETTDIQGRVARRTQTDFDALGRPWKHYDSAGNVTETRHDAEDRLNAVIDAKNRSTAYTRDALGRLKDITDPQPTPGHSGFNYDALDQLTQFVAPNGAATSFTVDGLGNVKQEVSADRGTVTATYDAAGNLLTRTDASGRSSVNTYDALNRLTQTKTKNSVGSVSRTLIYQWDEASGCNYGKGYLCEANDSAGSSFFNYDARGNRISEIRFEGGLNFQTRYTVNAADRVVAVLTPTGVLLDQPLDAAGRVSTLTATAGGSSVTVASAITYDGAGVPVALTQGGSLAQYSQRNADGRLELTALGLPVTNLNLSLAKRYIRADESLSVTINIAPSQASGTVLLCRLDCEGANLLAQGSLSAGSFSTTVTGLPRGIHHLSAVFVPNPPYTASTSVVQRLLVGISPTLFFDDLFVQ